MLSAFNVVITKFLQSYIEIYTENCWKETKPWNKEIRDFLYMTRIRRIHEEKRRELFAFQVKLI